MTEANLISIFQQHPLKRRDGLTVDVLDSVTITGENFAGASAVTFTDGVPAESFNVVSDTTITATVPPGATTGTISVTTPAGTGISCPTP